MGADADAKCGLVAKLGPQPDEVVAACDRAVQTLGRHGQMKNVNGKLMVEVYPGLFPPITVTSPKVAITIDAVGETEIRLKVRVERYKTSQSKLLGVIPVSKQRLVGKGYYFALLDALERELRQVGGPSAVIQRTGQAA